MASATRRFPSLNPIALFRRDERDEGVLRIHVYLLRFVYALVFFGLGQTTWSFVLTHTGSWNPREAIIWCEWTAFATIAALGIFRPLKMLPILMFEIFYKVMWLILVAYPLLVKGTLIGSPAEGTMWVFVLTILPIIAVPWGYLFRTYVYARRAPAPILTDT